MPVPRAASQRQPQPQPRPVAPPRTRPPADSKPSLLQPAPASRPQGPATPRAAPASSDANDPGFYLVDSRRYAHIYIDGKDYGETPLFRVPLAPGSHTVRAVLPDGRKQQLSIEIEAGKDLSSGRLRW